MPTHKSDWKLKVEKFDKAKRKKRTKKRSKNQYKFAIVTLLCLFSIICILPQISAILTDYYRADLSDTFNDGSFNTSKWNYTDNRGTSGFCGLIVDTIAETTDLRRTAGFSGISGIWECFSYQNTFTLNNYKSTNVFKRYDIYINQTKTLGGSATNVNSTFSVYNSTGGNLVGDLVLFGTAQANKIYHIRVNRPSQTIVFYNSDNSINKSLSVSNYNQWYIGWEDFVHGSATQAATFQSNSYNFSVFESDIAVEETSLTYSSTVYETASQTITSNVYWDNSTYGSVSAILYYDGMAHSVTQTINGNQATFTTTFDTPTTLTTDTVNFYFTYTLDGGSQNGDTYTQTINKTTFVECNTTYSAAFVNFTTFEEGTFLELNSSVELSFAYWLGNGSTYQILSYNNLNNNQSKYNFCFSPSTSTIHVTGVMDYYYIEPITNLTYSRRSHYFNNALLSSAGTYIPLYMLTTNSSTLFTFTVLDENSLPVTDAYINILRWDIGTGNFYTVDAVKTNQLGQGTAQIRLNDAWYVYEVIYKGNLLLTTSPQIETVNSRTLLVNVAQPSPYLSFNDLSYSFIYNNATKSFVFTYADTTGKVTIGCLRVINVNADNQTYFSCVNSAAGILSYTLTENATYVGNAIFYINTNNQSTYQTVKTLMITLGVPERFTKIGTFGRVAAILLIGTLGLIGVACGSIILACFLVVAGVIVSYMIGLIYFSPLVIYSIIGVAIIIAVLARRRLG